MAWYAMSGDVSRERRDDDRLLALMRLMGDPFRFLALIPVAAIALSDEDNPHVKAAKREILLAIKEELERELGETATSAPKRKKIEVEREPFLRIILG
ncbi:MAG: hypothetical protein ACP5T5_04245 [Thermoprotei archaeon]